MAGTFQMRRHIVKGRVVTYLLGRDHDADLLDGFGEFVWLNEAGVVQVKVLERLRKDDLLGGDA